MLLVQISGYLDSANIISRRLAAVAERARDVRPAYPEMVAIFQNIVAATFDTEGASGASGPWQPLAPRTVRERERLGYGGSHPILKRTGTLERSLTGYTGDTILVEQPNYLGIGTAVPYVVFHQSTDPRHRLPRRAVFDPTTDQKHALLLPLRQYLTGFEPTGNKQP